MTIIRKTNEKEFDEALLEFDYWQQVSAKANKEIIELLTSKLQPANNSELAWRKSTIAMLKEREKKADKKTISALYKMRIAMGSYDNKYKLTDLDIQQAKQVPIGNFAEFNKAGFITSIYNQSERTPSLKWWPKTNTFKCFSSGESGDVIKFVKDYQELVFGKKLTFYEIVKFILQNR